MLAKTQGLFRLVRDAELVQSNSGTSVLKLSLACSEKYKDKETQLFIDAVCFGKVAEILNRYAGSKGTQIMLSGKLQTETWEKDGQKRSKISMTIEDFDFVSGQKAVGAQPLQNGGQQQQSYQQQQQVYQPPVQNIPQDNQSEYHPNQRSFDIDEGIPF